MQASTQRADNSNEFRRALVDFFCRYFTSKELLWLLRGFESPGLKEALPSEGEPLAIIAQEGCDLLARHGWLSDEELFHHLYRARPKLKPTLDELYAAWANGRRETPPSAGDTYTPGGRRRVRLTLQAELGELTSESVEEILGVLRKFGGDSKLTIESITSGSVVLVLTGGPYATRIILNAVRTRQLTQVGRWTILAAERAEEYTPPYHLRSRPRAYLWSSEGSAETLPLTSRFPHDLMSGSLDDGHSETVTANMIRHEKPEKPVPESPKTVEAVPEPKGKHISALELINIILIILMTVYLAFRLLPRLKG